MNLLTQNTAISLLEQNNHTIRFLVNDMSSGLTIQKALQAPKMFQVRKSLGEENLIKLLCVIIKSFCDSIKAKNTMDTVDIFECAELIAGKYTHDSIKDIVMAFKQAKTKGMNFYSTVSTPVLFDILTEYMEEKAKYLEKIELDKKSFHQGSVRTEMGTIAANEEKRQQRIEQANENKQLKAIESEKKEIKKLADFINKNIDNVK